MFGRGADKVVSYALVVLTVIFMLPFNAYARPVCVGFLAGGAALDDDSFNGITIAGLRRLQKVQKVKVEVRCGGYCYDSVEKELNSLLAENARIVIINCSSNMSRILEYIRNHPEVIFIINDYKIDDYPNVSSISYGQRMGSYLVGALCSWQTKTGKIGFIGGNEHPVIKDFLAGFLDGVKYSGRDIEVDVKFVRSGKSEKGFEDPRQANILARRMYASGADIIFAVAGLSGNGVIHAARKTGNFVVGVDSDQDYMAEGTVLTSMMKRADVAVYKEVLSVIQGQFVPGCKVYDLSNGGVGLTEMKYSKHLISNEILAKLGELEAHLVSGSIPGNPSEY